jgi:hypothetical protein
MYANASTSTENTTWYLIVNVFTSSRASLPELCNPEPK